MNQETVYSRNQETVSPHHDTRRNTSDKAD